MAGRFENNSIVVDLEISSLTSDQINKKIPVILDTGFTSDLCLTYQEAFPLALTLVGFEDYNIADGSKVTFFECLGMVKFGNQKVLSSISIRPSGSLLMGVSLLRKLKCRVNVDFENSIIDIQQPPIIPITPIKSTTQLKVPIQPATTKKIS